MDLLAPWLCGGLSPWLWATLVATLISVAAAVAFRGRKVGRLLQSGAVALVALTVGLGAMSAPSESRCLDRAIDDAVAMDDLQARHDALLALADPRQATLPSEPQQRRLAEAFAAFPDRIRPRSLDVAGPRSLSSVRGALRARRAVLHACVEREPAGRSDEIVTWRMSVEADGRVSRAARVHEAPTDAAPTARDACLQRALETMTMEPADAWSRVTVELRLSGS